MLEYDLFFKKYLASREVLKYPYCGTRIESKEFLSEKICSSNIKVRKKIIKKAKLVMIYVDFIFRSTTAIASVTNGVIPSQAIGLPIIKTQTPIVRSINSNTHLSKKLLSALILETRTEKNSSENTIEVIEWNFPKSDFTKYREKRMAKWNKSDSSKIGTSKEKVLNQVLSIVSIKL